jgi:hypothetical protein
LYYIATGVLTQRKDAAKERDTRYFPCVFLHSKSLNRHGFVITTTVPWHLRDAHLFDFFFLTKRWKGYMNAPSQTQRSPNEKNVSTSVTQHATINHHPFRIFKQQRGISRYNPCNFLTPPLVPPPQRRMSSDKTCQNSFELP